MAIHRESTKGKGHLHLGVKAKGKEQKKRSNKRKEEWGGGGGEQRVAALFVDTSSLRELEMYMFSHS